MTTNNQVAQNIFTFKKALGVPDAFPAGPFTSEAAGSWRSFIINSQIYSQYVPKTLQDISFNQDLSFNPTNGGGFWFLAA